MTTVDELAHAEQLIQAAARVLLKAVLRSIEADPHQWSTRPCETCRFVSAIIERPFGCSAKAQRREHDNS